jgi:hypothetical protein
MTPKGLTKIIRKGAKPLINTNMRNRTLNVSDDIEVFMFSPDCQCIPNIHMPTLKLK